MFTGLVAATARVISASRRSTGVLLTLERPGGFEDVVVGESVAVSGVCLTALEAGGKGVPLTFEVSPETLDRTTLGARRPGERVNLERALSPSDRLGGHVVAGHVDATTAVVGIREDGDFLTFTFALGKAWSRYVVEKGSIALDGISLTVAALRPDSFDVAVVPHTHRMTNFSERRPSDLVNVEVDILGKYVERLLEARLAGGDASESKDERLRRLLSPS